MWFNWFCSVKPPAIPRKLKRGGGMTFSDFLPAFLVLFPVAILISSLAFVYFVQQERWGWLTMHTRTYFIVVVVVPHYEVKKNVHAYFGLPSFGWWHHTCIHVLHCPRRCICFRKERVYARSLALINDTPDDELPPTGYAVIFMHVLSVMFWYDLNNLKRNVSTLNFAICVG